VILPVYLTAFLIIIIFSFWLSLSFVERYSKLSIHQSLETVLKLTEESLQLQLDSHLEHIGGITHNAEFLQLTQALLLEHKNGLNLTRSEIQNQLRALIKDKLHQIKSIGFFIIAPNRISIASQRNSNVGSENIINQQGKNYLDWAFLGESQFIPTITDNSNASTIFIACPIFDSDANVIAVFALQLNSIDDFSRITELGRIGKTGKTYTLDSKEQLITPSLLIKMYKSNNGNSGSSNIVLPTYITNSGRNMTEGPAPKLAMQDSPLTLMVRQIIANNTFPHLEPYLDYRGVSVFGAWTWNQ